MRLIQEQENPIVTYEEGYYLVIFDYLLSEDDGFGFSYSNDGILWNDGQLIQLPRGVRTKIAVIPSHCTPRHALR